MPGGTTLLGYGAFVAVKFVGYSAAGVYFRKRFASPSTSPLEFGLRRTLLGMAFGTAVGGMFMFVQLQSPIPFLIALLPIRVFEWHIIFAHFFKVYARTRRGLAVDLATGTAWSYALDAIAIYVAFVMPGGFWVC